jgi:hypothetical protein
VKISDQRSGRCRNILACLRKTTDEGTACGLIGEQNLLNAFHGLQMAFFRLFRQGLMACIYASTRRYPDPCRGKPEWRVGAGANADAFSPAQGRICAVTEGDTKGE